MLEVPSNLKIYLEDIIRIFANFSYTFELKINAYPKSEVYACTKKLISITRNDDLADILYSEEGLHKIT